MLNAACSILIPMTVLLSYTFGSNPDAPLEGGMETPSDSAAALGFDGEEDDDYYDDDFD